MYGKKKRSLTKDRTKIDVVKLWPNYKDQWTYIYVAHVFSRYSDIYDKVMNWILSMIILCTMISEGLENQKFLKMIKDALGLKIFLDNIIFYILRWRIKKNKWIKNMKGVEEKRNFGQFSSLFKK